MSKSNLKEEAAAGAVTAAATGATTAGNVAGKRGLLFTGIRELTHVRKKVAGVPVIQFSKRNNLNVRTKGITEGKISFSNFLAEDAALADSDFDASDVISKLSQNAKIADDLDGDEMAVFGMESDDGSITKVYIPKEQAKDFENALADRLKDNVENTEEEIAGVLFDLKDRFKIIDVKWPTIQEDEEQVPEDPMAGDPMAGDPAAMGAEGDPVTMDPNADPSLDPAGGAAPGGDAVGDQIAQILDMLRADAEARKAESDAKSAEAKAKEAEAAAKLAGIKLQGEEEVLDAEAHFKDKKEEKKEAERLKMLARFRQETKMSQDTSAAPAPEVAPDSGNKDEDEEHVTLTRKQLLNILSRG